MFDKEVNTIFDVKVKLIVALNGSKLCTLIKIRPRAIGGAILSIFN